MSTSTTYMTFEQFEQLPDEPNKLELIDGEVVRMPPPFTQHSRIAMRFYEALKQVVLALRAQGQARDLGEVAHEFGYHIGSHWLQPDVSITHAGANRERLLGRRPGAGRRGYIQKQHR